MSQYHLIAADNESTVVSEYTAEYRPAAEYQSEAALEQDFLRLLQGQGYEHINVSNEAGLVANLRRQLEALNDYTFSESEWERFFNESIAGANDGIVEKTRRIQDDHVQNLRRDDGTTKNISLIDKKNIHNNRLQVNNQYSTAGGAAATGGTGVPPVSRGVPPRHSILPILSTHSTFPAPDGAGVGRLLPSEGSFKPIFRS